MLARLRFICELLLPILASASVAGAAEVDFRLDPSSFVRQSEPEITKTYAFPPGARVRFRFGERTGDSIPVTVPPGGLQLGIVRGEGLPPIEFELTAPATGTLTVRPEGTGSIVLQGKLLVKRVGGLRGVERNLTFAIDLVPVGITGKGYMQITTEGALARDSAGPVGSYLAVVGGKLDSLPPGFP